MRIEGFALERYFAKHEFSAKYLLSSSDCQPLAMGDLLEMANTDSQRLWQNLSLGYTETAGHPELRAELSKVYGPNIGPQNLMLAAPQENILLLMFALLKPGDHMVCTYPAYQSLFQLAHSIGCQVSHWTPDEDRGWTFDLDQLRQQLRPETKLLVINFPHNPTGYTPSEGDFRQLLAEAEQRGIYVFSDEMYRFLQLDDGTGLPAACDLYPKAVTLGGLSKAFGLPGLRIGWLATQELELLDRVAHLKDYTTICASAPSEILALIALQNRQQILQQQRRRLRSNRLELERFLQKHSDDLDCVLPKAGPICFARLKRATSSQQFCQQLLQQTGIMLVPSGLFRYGDNHVRIGFGRQDLPQVLARLSRFLS